VLKFDSIYKFFDSILDGTATLTPLDPQVPEDSHKLSPEEEEVERKQEAQRLALLHGGFTNMIDFEKAIEKYVTGFHGAHGYSAPPDEKSNDQTRVSGRQRRGLARARGTQCPAQVTRTRSPTPLWPPRQHPCLQRPI
jgi:protein disulfide-isomerase A6